MAEVIFCERVECIFNEGGKCEQFYGIEIDEFGECKNFDKGEETMYEMRRRPK